MRQRGRRFASVLAAGLLILVASASSCDSPEEDTDSEREEAMPSLTNDLEGGELTIEHAREGANAIPELPPGMTITSFYRTDYDVEDWQIIDTKYLEFGLSVDPGAEREGMEVLVEHAHADIVLLSTLSATDGLTQDSMDDSIHGGTQPGFSVMNGARYVETFAIEGLNMTFLQGYIDIYSGYGYGELSDHRPTEKEFREEGVYGNKLTVVYDVVFRMPSEPYFRKVTFADEITIEITEPKD